MKLGKDDLSKNKNVSFYADRDLKGLKSIKTVQYKKGSHFSKDHFVDSFNFKVISHLDSNNYLKHWSIYTTPRTLDLNFDYSFHFNLNGNNYTYFVEDIKYTINELPTGLLCTLDKVVINGKEESEFIFKKGLE